MRVTVVVPTFRRPDLLARCLEALARQDVGPSSFEVVVADDEASHATRSLVEGLARRFPAPSRYVAVTGPHGPAAARNAGWRAATGEVIAFTDDDCVPEPCWLRAGLAALAGGAAAAAGRVVVPLPEPPTDYQRNESGLERAEFVTANCLVRRDVLESLGGFDERFSAAWREDSDLHFALLAAGHSIVAAPLAVVVHPVRPARWGVSLRQQWKSSFDALLFKKHPDLYRRRIRANPPWDYYAIVLFAAAAVGFACARLVWPAAVAGASWAALTGRFCARRLRGNSRATGHVAEMVLTSALIPFLSVFWRLYGAARFRVPFL
ncbi:MAG TPA: glycosyltransferase [Isosphaeraceae bacterium]|jgi:glycosyltransferase involved in cell wall biosynthesis|nr:glycosyltransferase [Isosphaeraceae bacterium]